MQLWVWISDSWEGAIRIEAVSHDDAYEIAIQERMKVGQTREEAETWFTEHDQIERVTDSPPLR